LVPSDPQVPRASPRDSADIADIAEFILRITEDIWERKNVDLIYDCYSEDGPIHTLGGEVIGAETVVRNTVNTLEAFPDRKMHADGLVIGGEEDAGYYSSHRIGSQMTHLGPGDFGPATGNSAHVVTIADCLIRDYVIVEEWLARDNLHLVEQLGLDAHGIAKAQAAIEPDAPSLAWRNEQLQRLRSLPPAARVKYPENPMAEPGLFAAAVISDFWDHRNARHVSDAYARSCVLNVPPGQKIEGRSKAENHFTRLLASLTDTRASLDHHCVSRGDNNELDLAIRWTVRGMHVDGGFDCPGDGAELLILGISHWRINKEGIVEDWTLYDQLAIMRQIYAQQPGSD
jgi:predicted ester cyclase